MTEEGYGKKPDKSSVLTVVEVFQRFTDYKAKFVQPKTSHALEAGVSPTTIAAMTGHSVQVLYEHYAAAIKAPQLPDILTYQAIARLLLAEAATAGTGYAPN